MWADNAESSPRFGNVYVCYTQFRSQRPGPEPIAVSRSTDGGDTWSQADHAELGLRQRRQHPGRQGCAIRTDSKGIVYAVWEDTVKKQSRVPAGPLVRRRRQASRSRAVVANVTDVGQFDGVRSISFDGIAGRAHQLVPEPRHRQRRADRRGRAGHAGARLVRRPRRAQQRARAGAALRQRRQTLDRPDRRSEQSGRSARTSRSSASRPTGTDLYVVYDGFLDPFRDDTTIRGGSRASPGMRTSPGRR